MKYTIYLIIFICAATAATAQNTTARLAGDWQATCLLEKQNENEVSFCKICPIELSAKGDSLTLASVIFNFNDQKLSIVSQKGRVTTDIQYNASTEHLTFILDGEAYDFTVLIVEEAYRVILKNMDGHLVYLERKNIQPGR